MHVDKNIVPNNNKLDDKAMPSESTGTPHIKAPQNEIQNS